MRNAKTDIARPWLWVSLALFTVIINHASAIGAQEVLILDDDREPQDDITVVVVRAQS